MAKHYTQHAISILKEQQAIRLENKVGIINIDFNRHKLSLRAIHVWKSPSGKIKEYYSSEKLGDYQIPEGMIEYEEKTETILSSRYFQTDDMHETEVKIVKKISPSNKAIIIEMYHKNLL